MHTRVPRPQDACAKHGVTYNVGTGYYAVARSEVRSPIARPCMALSPGDG